MHFRHPFTRAALFLEGMAPGQHEGHDRHVRETVRRWTGIPLGVSVAVTKALARLANSIGQIRNLTDQAG